MNETMSGAELYALRSSWGLSITDIAHELGRNERTIRRWESGEARLSMAVTAQIQAIDQYLNELAEVIMAAGISTIERGVVPTIKGWENCTWNFFLSAAGRAVNEGHRIDFVES